MKNPIKLFILKWCIYSDMSSIPILKFFLFLDRTDKRVREIDCGNWVGCLAQWSTYYSASRRSDLRPARAFDLFQS